MKASLAVLAVSMGVAFAASATPATNVRDPLIEGARQCTQYFPVEEKKNRIPTHLLAAIATTESGRYHEGLGMSVPWPWTINVEGKGYYFNSKAEAIAQVQAFMAKGIQSIDVGCMQVNLKHHPRAFTDLNQAFDPAANVNYAARFLRDNYASLGDWIKATAAYHSRTEARGQKYLVEIERSWNKIVAKVAAARAGKGGDAPMKPTAMAMMTPRAAESLPRVISSAKPMATAQRARVIEVHETPKSTGVLVVNVAQAMKGNNVEASVKEAKAEVVVKEEPVTVASVDAAAAAPVVVSPSVTPVGNSIRRVSLDKSAASALATPQAAGPKFVFAN